MDNSNNIFENDEIRIVHPDDIPKEARVHAPATQAAPSARESSQYVTKKFFVIALILAIILTSAISSAVAIFFTKEASHYRNLTVSGLDVATGSKLTVAEIVAKNEDSVVEITTSSKSTNILGQTEVSEGAGSGVIVNDKGFIATNYHVIQGATAVKVRLHNGETHSAKIVGSDPDNDIAVIKITATNLKAVTLGDSGDMAVGDLTVAIGNPLGQLGGTATTGIVSALERRLTIGSSTLTLIQTDAAINPGNSGGGLFNGAGELVGIVVAKSSGTGIEGLGFAIPINQVADLIDDLITDGKVSGKPSIGIVITDVADENAAQYDLPCGGTYITEVTSEEAKTAGLKEMDRLISIDGKTFESSSDFVSQVRTHKVGDTVTLVIERNGKEMTIKTNLIESTVTN